MVMLVLLVLSISFVFVSSKRPLQCGSTRFDTEYKPIFNYSDYLGMNCHRHDFEAIRAIGKGHSGYTHKAIHHPTGKVVLLKYIHGSRYNPRYFTSLRNEECTMHEADSELVAHHYCTFVDDADVVLVEEFVEGATLKTMKALGKISENNFPGFMVQLIKGVEYLHAIGIQFNDVKPTNLILTPTLKLKIVDFGMAHFYDPSTPTKQAPKLRTRRADGFNAVLDAKTIADDWYDVGLMLYYLYTGEEPLRDIPGEYKYHLKFVKGIECKGKLVGMACDLFRRMTSPRSRDVKKHPYFHAIDWSK